MVIRGQEATGTSGGPGATIEPQGAAGGRRKREEFVRRKAGSLEEHWKDFLRCIGTREKPRSSDAIGCRVMAALHGGIRSFLEGKVYEYDEA